MFVSSGRVGISKPVKGTCVISLFSSVLWKSKAFRGPDSFPFDREAGHHWDRTCRLRSRHAHVGATRQRSRDCFYCHMFTCLHGGIAHVYMPHVYMQSSPATWAIPPLEYITQMRSPPPHTPSLPPGPRGAATTPD